MKLIIDVGEAEKHQIEYNFNQLSGQLEIKIDTLPVKKSKRLFNEPVLETHAFEVGQNERLHIRIEKERKALFGHRNRVYLNDRLLKVAETNLSLPLLARAWSWRSLTKPHLDRLVRTATVRK